MDPKLFMYVAYLLLSAGLTAWVARVLFRNGQVFLDDALGDERLARSVNNLLVVGFYLLNLGYAAVAIRVSDSVTTASDAVATLSVKIGLVLLVLGAIHFGNLRGCPGLAAQRAHPHARDIAAGLLSRARLQDRGRRQSLRRQLRLAF